MISKIIFFLDKIHIHLIFQYTRAKILQKFNNSCFWFNCGCFCVCILAELPVSALKRYKIQDSCLTVVLAEMD